MQNLTNTTSKYIAEGLPAENCVLQETKNYI